MKTWLSVALLALGMGLWATNAAPTQAQSQDESCYLTVEQPFTRENPFTGEITSGVEEVLVYDDDCRRIQDDRINPDGAAAAAIYCTPTGVDIYDIDRLGRGTLALRVTYEAMGAVGFAPEENTPIVSEGGFTLWRLTNGQLELTSPPDHQGKTYAFTWSGCAR